MRVEDLGHNLEESQTRLSLFSDYVRYSHEFNNSESTVLNVCTGNIGRPFIICVSECQTGKKNSRNGNTVAAVLILNRVDYSAFRVKRLKSTIFSSGSAAANTSLTVFLPSMMSSWFSRQTSFMNLARRPLAMF